MSLSLPSFLKLPHYTDRNGVDTLKEIKINISVRLALDNMGEKLVLNFGAKFQCYLTSHVKQNVAVATFPEKPKWRPGLKMLQIMSFICHL